MREKLIVSHQLFDSIEEMLSLENLSTLLKRKVTHINCQHLNSPYGLSGNQTFYVYIDSERFVMKFLMPKSDWLAIATDDKLCRSVTVWQYGLLDCIHPHMNHATLAGCRDGDGYAILMYDVTEGLLYERKIIQSELFSLLDALAAMHSIFWEDDSLKDSQLGLCDVANLIKYTLPTMFDQHAHNKETVERLSRGWDLLLDLLEPDVRNDIQSLINNSQPLLDILATLPSTFLHADYKTGNIAFFPNSKQVVTLDWQCATYAPMTIDLAWFLMSSNIFREYSTVLDIAEYYRSRLVARLNNRFDHRLWQRMLELGFLVDMLRKGCWYALYTVTRENETDKSVMQSIVKTYNNLARQGLKWL